MDTKCNTCFCLPSDCKFLVNVVKHAQKNMENGCLIDVQNQLAVYFAFSVSSYVHFRFAKGPLNHLYMVNIKTVVDISASH